MVSVISEGEGERKKEERERERRKREGRQPPIRGRNRSFHPVAGHFHSFDKSRRKGTSDKRWEHSIYC
jgi:hypothetical protein